MTRMKPKASGILTLRIPPEVHDWLRRHAVSEHMTVNRLMVRILCFYKAAAEVSDDVMTSPLFDSLEDKVSKAIHSAVERASSFRVPPAWELAEAVSKQLQEKTETRKARTRPPKRKAS